MKRSVMLIRHTVTESHPARGAWIETHIKTAHRATNTVAPREGCVD